MVERVVDPCPAANPPDFDAFFSAHVVRLRRYACRWLAASDAEDVAQETLSRALVHWDQFDGSRDPWPWLSVVARNQACDLLRARSTCTFAEAEAEPAADGQEWSSVPEQEALGRECSGMLGRAMAVLTPRQQQVVQLRAVQGMSIGEIADLFGTTPNAARQQLFRARRSLEAAYRAAGGSLPAATPLGALLAGVQWVRRHLREFGAGAAPASLGVAAVAAVAVMTVLLPSPQEQPQSPTAGVTTSAAAVEAAPAPTVGAALYSASATHQETGALSAATPAGAPPPAPSQPSSVAAPSARALPVTPTLSADVASRPVAPAESSAAQVTVETPAGTVVVDTHLRNGEAGPVCRTEIQPCS
jgi:RNA polymerase sigma-70 factor (ECF subfamily)